MSKAYYFNVDEYTEAFDKIYPITGLNNKINYDNLSQENFWELKKAFENVINNPQLKEKTKYERVNEEITCLPEQAKTIFAQLFENEDLFLYGHGGAAKEIFESGVFKCRYADLQSHFVQLHKTNESLNKLNDWPHKGATRIAILAINNTEYNPIYKAREKATDYDTDIYSISNEYFVGYYDNEKKNFVLNPNFKINHEYEPENTIYTESERYSYSIPKTDDKIVIEFFKNLSEIRNVLFFASLKNLSKDGYINVKKQVLNLMEKAEKLQKQMTPEYLNNLKNSEKSKLIENENVDDGMDFDFDDWSFDDWEDEKDTNKKR